MKRKILIIAGKLVFMMCVMFYAEDLMAQTPGWKWARQAGGSSGETLRSTSRDANGNIYAIGSFISPTISFGNITLTNSGNNDVYIVKYDPDGNAVWARNFLSGGSEVSLDISADPNGNLIIIGWFSGTSLSIDNIVVNNSGGTCTGGWGFPGSCADIFVVKLDPNGNVIWAKSFGMPSRSESVSGVGTDQNGNIYLTGEFTGSISFGTTTLSTEGGMRAIFVTKFDGDGNANWAKAAPGGNNYCRDMSVDASGNIVLTGSYDFSITFDNTTLTYALGHIFVAKYSSAGNLLWAKGEGGRNNSGSTTGITTQGNETYITGSFTSSAIKFGKINLKNCRSCTNMFLVKYDASGNAAWVRTATNASNIRGNAVSADTDGNVFVTGSYINSTATFGNFLLVNNGSADIFLAKYNSAGNPVWALGVGGSSNEGTNSVIADGSGSVYLSGGFSSPSLSFGNNILTNIGQSDLFIAKADDVQDAVVKHPSYFSNEKIDNLGYKIYPNPAFDRINFQLPADIQSPDLQLSIYNVQGVRLKEITAQSVLTTIPLKGFKPGVYFYRIVKKGVMIYSGKFIVK